MSPVRPWLSAQEIFAAPLGGRKNTRSVADAVCKNRSFTYQNTWRTLLPAAHHLLLLAPVKNVLVMVEGGVDGDGRARAVVGAAYEAVGGVVRG